VLFAVPWLGKTVLGTTDTPRADAPAEPLPLAEEVDFILREAARHLERAPTRADVRSAWVGLRPLVRPAAAGSGQTKSISREHTVAVSATGLVTVTGGKWTTARAMADDVLAQCQRHGLLSSRPARRGAAPLPLLGAAPYIVVNVDVWTDFDFAQRPALDDPSRPYALVEVSPNRWVGCWRTPEVARNPSRLPRIAPA
jgi:glycerol-3-phosphate dehydrogenase